MQDISETGYILLAGLAIFVVGTWMIGRMVTSKLRNKVAQNVATRFQATTSKVSVRLLGNTGAKFSFHQKSSGPFSKLETSVLLLDRSNMFHMIYCRARGRTDQLQIRANLRRPPTFGLELATRREQHRLEEALKDRSESVRELEIENLTEQFYVVASDHEASENLFRSPQFRIDAEAVRPYLTRLSIAHREPHVFVSVKLVPEAMEPTESFVLSLANYLGPRKKRH
ncbi:MAG: hypothetical protein ACE5H4_04695 [Candidatus Thorarchaeota archaeon]